MTPLIAIEPEVTIGPLGVVCACCDEPVGDSRSRCEVDGPLCGECSYDGIDAHNDALAAQSSEDDGPTGEPPTCPACGDELEYIAAERAAPGLPATPPQRKCLCDGFKPLWLREYEAGR